MFVRYTSEIETKKGGLYELAKKILSFNKQNGFIVRSISYDDVENIPVKEGDSAMEIVRKFNAETKGLGESIENIGFC